MRRLRALALCGAVLAALLAVGVGTAIPEPATIDAQRAEVARIQDELAQIDDQVEAAAEAYNGAVYEYDQVQGRITQNTADIKVTQRNLERMRAVLAERLRAIYTTPQPSLADVLVSSGSISEAADKLQLLGQVGEQDARMVGDLKADRAKLAELRTSLIADRASAARQVDAKKRQRERVGALLAQRRQVLDSAQGRLGQMLAAEEARQEAEATRQAQLARQRIASEQSTPASPSPATPSQPDPSPAGPSPAPSPTTTPAPSSTTAPAPAGDGANARAASVALRYLGVPYVWGGASPSGFDCSGLLSYAYGQVGKSVPHYTGAIWAAFPKVSSGDLQPGDAVFFNGLNHVGMYIGGGQYVVAPHTGDVVKVQSMSGRSDYMGAVRP